MTDEASLAWVEQAVGARPDDVHSLRDGGSPWLLRFPDRPDLVLRVGDRDASELIRIEAVGLAFAAASGVPVPAVVAADVDGDPPRLLVDAVRGSSTIPVEAPAARLHRLGAIAATLHAIEVLESAQLPFRSRPISGVDFAALRAKEPPNALMQEAQHALNAQFINGSSGFVHGDLWQGNCLWDGDELVALIDWDCAGRGWAGVDLGSLRCDAALCFGADAAGLVLAGWEEAAGRPADDVAYWDVVAALSTPTDMGWFVGAIHGQGRTDLTRELLVERRDAFLAAGLDVIK